jgi:capsular exopolysaccharide synthesis family protein
VLEQAASQLLAETGTALSIRDFDGALTIRWSQDSSVATAAFSAPTEEIALAATNALLEAYQRLLIDQATANSSATIEHTNQAISDMEDEITRLESQLAEASIQDAPVIARINQLSAEAAAITAEMASANAATREVLADRLAAITVEMDILSVLGEVTPERPLVRQLERQLEQAVSEQSSLIERRTNLQIDLSLNAPPTVVFSSARILETSPLSLPLRYAVTGALLGLFVAGARAYTREVRDETIESGAEPSVLVGAPLLAEISDFDVEGVSSQLPVRDDPRSLAAEGFRFLAASTEIRMADLYPRSIAIVGTSVGAGKTTTTANLALAMAKQGARVLVLDADFGNQALSEMFGIDNLKVAGITDIINGQAKILEAGAQVLGVEGNIRVIGRGHSRAIAPALFRTNAASKMFEDLAKEFDLVIVDTPPLLQIAYATTLVALVGASIVVIPQGSSVADVVATAARLRSIGSNILGYTLHRARTDPRPRIPEGSLRDVVGDDGYLTPQKSRSRE